MTVTAVATIAPQAPTSTAPGQELPGLRGNHSVSAQQTSAYVNTRYFHHPCHQIHEIGQSATLYQRCNKNLTRFDQNETKKHKNETHTHTTLRATKNNIYSTVATAPAYPKIPPNEWRFSRLIVGVCCAPHRSASRTMD